MYKILERVFNDQGEYIDNKIIGAFKRKPTRKLKKNQAIFKVSKPAVYNPALAFPAANRLGIED